MVVVLYCLGNKHKYVYTYSVINTQKMFLKYSSDLQLVESKNVETGYGVPTVCVCKWTEKETERSNGNFVQGKSPAQPHYWKVISKSLECPA